MSVGPNNSHPTGRSIGLPAIGWIRPNIDQALTGWADNLVTQGREIASLAVSNVDWPTIVLPPEVLKTFADLAAGLLNLIPDNLHGLQGEDWVSLVAISQEQAISAAWVIDRAIVQALLSASSAEGRAAVIDEHAADIVATCAHVLDSVSGEDFAGLVGLLRQSILAYQAGHTNAAQALSTNCLETGLEQHVEKGSRAARRYIHAVVETQEEEQQENSVRVLRWRLVAAGIPTAYMHSDRAPVGLFNRNGTVHAASPSLYTPGNAARATTLATSWLRWLQELDNERERRRRRSTLDTPS